jgi:hemerythrin-like domain-containing protein
VLGIPEPIMKRAEGLLNSSLRFVAGGGNETVLDVIKGEHREAAQLLDEAVALEPGDAKTATLAKKIEVALTTHVTIEERLFYGRLRARAEEEDERVDVFEAYTEHELVRHLIALLRSQRRRDERFKAELQVLAENVKHHVKEEESTVFSLARKLLDEDELVRIGIAWRKAKGERVPGAAPSGARAKKAPDRKQPARKAGARKASATRKKAQPKRGA